MSAFKDYFNAQSAALIAEPVAAVYPPFDVDGFIAQVAAGVPDLELKERVLLMAHALRARLPPAYPEAVQILVDSLNEELGLEEGMFNDGFHLMPVARFVEEFGLDHWRESMAAINAITRRHTGEFAIRPFIEQYPEATLTLLAEWARSDNVHVRRLVSEGIRPRLPWASQLRPFIADPQPVLDLLELLRDDEAVYVQKSVGNNLNDIAKDHPERVLDMAARWLRESPTDNTRAIVKRALRTLEKANHPHALELLGYTGGGKIKLVDFYLDESEIPIGDSLTFTVAVRNTDSRPHMLTLNYALHLVRKNGGRNVKVFKLGTFELGAGAAREITKSQSFQPVTVRRYYPGTHQIDVVVNGLEKGSAAFVLV